MKVPYLITCHIRQVYFTNVMKLRIFKLRSFIFTNGSPFYAAKCHTLQPEMILYYAFTEIAMLQPMVTYHQWYIICFGIDIVIGYYL